MQLAWIDPQTDYPVLDVEHLRQNGVTYERFELDDDAYLGPLAQLKRARGYIEQDVIELHPNTEKLDELCAKFAAEHLHTDDEVRFVLAGEGVFDIRDADDRWMRITVQPGDLIVVPKDRYHRFFLSESKQIRCVRLFQDSAGWVPHYR